MWAQAQLRFFEALNDFLSEERRGREFAVAIDRARSVKDAIESVGVPHPEVGSIQVDGAPAGFNHVLRGGERVEVHAAYGSDGRFVADGHLGKLARHLRMAGFDTLCANEWNDDEIVRISIVQGRTILTRDKGMLRRGDVERGYFVRATASEEQLREVVRRLRLDAAMRPFTRCRECNLLLEVAARDRVRDRVPERVAELYRDFKRCPGCERVYWEGSHFARMKGVLERASGV